jgi:hypothetical protein
VDDVITHPTAPLAETPPPAGSTTASLPEVSRSVPWWRQWQLIVCYLVALIPLGVMAARVHKAPQMQFQDYWTTLLRITNPDGSAHWRGFLTYQNEHPFTVPSVVYYLDAKLFHGTNHVLGYYSILVAAITVVLLRFLLPKQWSPLARAALTVLVSAAVFCPSGLWNFSRGMSGTAWLSANVFAVAAVYFAWRRQTLVAVPLAALSVLSYGTGFAAPVAIIGVSLLRKDARWRWLLPTAMLVCAGVIYMATRNPSTTGTGVSHDPALLASTFLSNLGMLWDPTAGTLAVTLGAAGLLVLALAFTQTWKRAEFEDLTPWWGVAVYSILAAALISLARSEVFGGSGVQSRYASLSALFWVSVGIVGLRVLLARRGLALQIGAVVAAVVVFYAESPSLVTEATADNKAQDLLATAVRVNAAGPYSTRFYQPAQQIPRLMALHDYPFSSGYSLGCGGLVPGDSIDPTKVRTLTLGRGGNYGALDSDALNVNARQFRGWLQRGRQPIQCVLVIDPAGKIVGGGVSGFPRNDVAQTVPGLKADVGFEAVAPSSAANARLVFGFSDGYWMLPHPITH